MIEAPEAMVASREPTSGTLSSISSAITAETAACSLGESSGEASRKVRVSSERRTIRGAPHLAIEGTEHPSHAGRTEGRVEDEPAGDDLGDGGSGGCHRTSATPIIGAASGCRKRPRGWRRTRAGGQRRRPQRKKAPGARRARA